MKFEKAERKKARLRLALTGPSGSGKTFGALQIAKGIGGRIAVIDTEKGSASLYSHIVDFDALELPPPYTPERFVEAVKAAEEGGYDVLIIDSITHEWSGKGGCLELVDDVAKAKFRGNSWSAWNEVTPRHRAFLDSLLASPMHVIATMRSKTETAQTEGPNGKKQVVKLGMKAEQRDGSEYEFTTVLDIVHDGHFAIASKDRTGLFTDRDAKQISPETGAELLAWLESGAEPKPEDTPEDIAAARAWEARKVELRAACDAAIDMFGRDDEAGAYDMVSGVFESVAESDNDNKQFIWSYLRPHSKIRTMIKARVEQAREIAAMEKAKETAPDAEEVAG